MENSPLFVLPLFLGFIYVRYSTYENRVVRRLVGHQIILHYITRGLVVLFLAAVALFVVKSFYIEFFTAVKKQVFSTISVATGDWIYDKGNRVIRISVGLLMSGLATVFVLLQTYDRLITRDVQSEAKLFKNLVRRTYEYVYLVKKAEKGIFAAWWFSLKAVFGRKNLRKVIWDMLKRSPSWLLQKAIYNGDYYRHIIAKYGDELEMLIFEATNAGKELSITMEDGKVYIGIVIYGVRDSHSESKYITILPLKSGYRDDENRTIQITTDYSSFANLRQEEATDLIKVIPVDRIVTVGVYREDLNLYFREKTRQYNDLMSGKKDRRSGHFDQNDSEVNTEESTSTDEFAEQAAENYVRAAREAQGSGSRSGGRNQTESDERALLEHSKESDSKNTTLPSVKPPID